MDISLENKFENYKKIELWYVNSLRKMNELEKRTYKQNVSFAQYTIMLSILEDTRKYSSPSEIAERVSMAKSSISRALKSLQKKGFISKSYGETEDQRKVEIRVTNEGKNIVNRIKKEFNELD